MGKTYSCCYSQKKRRKNDLKQDNQLQDLALVQSPSNHLVRQTQPEKPYVDNQRQIQKEIGSISNNKQPSFSYAYSNTMIVAKEDPAAKEKDLESYFDLEDDFQIPMSKSIYENAHGILSDQDKSDWLTKSLYLLTKDFIISSPKEVKSPGSSPKHLDAPSQKASVRGHDHEDIDVMGHSLSGGSKGEIKALGNARIDSQAEGAKENNNFLSGSPKKIMHLPNFENKLNDSNEKGSNEANILLPQSSYKSPTKIEQSHITKSKPHQEEATLQDGHQGVQDIRANLNYDPVLNKNLKPVNNMILDDSILEGQGFTSTGKRIISESSSIDGHIFPPWNKHLHEEMKYYCPLKGLWEDPEFSFNVKKLQETYATGITIERISRQSGATIFDNEAESVSSIKQGKVWTSSLISSLIVILDFESKKKGNFTKTMIYPQDNLKHIVNPDGKYGIKIYFNGSKRLIEIDDRLAFETVQGQKTRSLLGASSINKLEFRVSLIEKAICKLYSSDTMVLPSIPSIECYHLTGWTPEIIKVNEIANVNHLWQRLMQNYRDNNILISLGTKSYDQSVDTNTLEYQLGCYKDPVTDVILDHSYSVLGLAEVKSLKCIKLKNPWGHTHAKLFNVNECDVETLNQICVPVYRIAYI